MKIDKASTHPNRIWFTGVLCVVDESSDKPPGGARGHCVMITKRTASEAIHSLIGMGVNWSEVGKHNPKVKVGIITDASIGERSEIKVEGFLYGRDFPDVISCISASSEDLGMSYEIADAHVADMRSTVWKLDKVTFTGATILPRTKAAYRTTKFAIIGVK